VYTETWEEHMIRLRELFLALRKASLVVNLAKSDFGKASVTYLGHEVGHGQVVPKESNIQAIINFPSPKNRKNVMQFMGLAGYYRKFVLNFSKVAAPITDLPGSARKLLKR